MTEQMEVWKEKIQQEAENIQGKMKIVSTYHEDLAKEIVESKNQLESKKLELAKLNPASKGRSPYSMKLEKDIAEMELSIKLKSNEKAQLQERIIKACKKGMNWSKELIDASQKALKDLRSLEEGVRREGVVHDDDLRRSARPRRPLKRYGEWEYPKGFFGY